MKAYKIFEKLKNGALMSGGRLPRAMQFCYSRKNVNIPKIEGSKFFVFRELNHAMLFYKSEKSFYGGRKFHGKLEIWEIDIPILITIPYTLDFPNVWSWYDDDYSVGINLPKIREFWQGNKNGLNLGSIFNDVYHAKSIKLVKRVEPI